MAGKKQPAPNKPSKGGGGAGKPITTNSTRTSSSSSSSSSKAQKPPPQQTTTENRESEEELRRQQTLLNIFSNTFRDVLEADDFASQLQEVKGALFNRDFEGAFAREAVLDVYAARWSPTRALCYARVLRGLDAHLKGLVSARVNHSPENDETSTRDAEHEHESAHDDRDGSAAVKEDIQSAESGEQEEEEEASTITAEQGDDADTVEEEEEEEGKTRPLKVLAIGGAAAEIVAFADYISSQVTTTSTTTTPLRGEITLLDIGPWGSVVSRLQTALTSAPPISRYASAAAKAMNAALVAPSQFRSGFIQKDILSLPGAELAALIPVPAPVPGGGNTPILITLLFTLNELYTAGGIKQTTAFLRLLSSPSVGLAPGSLLLVVDSPGSYSEAAVARKGKGKGKDGEEEEAKMKKMKKRYPMQWLLEHTLIPPTSPSRRRPREESKKKEKEPGQAGTEKGPKEEEDQRRPAEEEGEKGEKGEGGIRWEKIESHDSVWFRVAEGLCYPIPLENMRYQMHLYRACVG
ncbi:hypothetical protein F5B21DRAFT_473473 [Xylaria acuta]|nr:hypothetical protein F5B21DRAFT_473473 [Xylaria acuta]